MTKPLFPPKEDPPTWTNSEWRSLTDQEREWYILFWRATCHHDWRALRELCDRSGADFERLYAELTYEGHLSQRMAYTVNKHRKPRFSELDYNWKKPRKIQVRDMVEALRDEKDWKVFKEGKLAEKIQLDPPPHGPVPVRKVSAEEYYATRKTPLPKGVNLEIELKYAKKEKEDATDGE